MSGTAQNSPAFTLFPIHQKPKKNNEMAMSMRLLKKWIFFRKKVFFYLYFSEKHAILIYIREKDFLFSK